MATSDSGRRASLASPAGAGVRRASVSKGSPQQVVGGEAAGSKKSSKAKRKEKDKDKENTAGKHKHKKKRRHKHKDGEKSKHKSKKHKHKSGDDGHKGKKKRRRRSTRPEAPTATAELPKPTRPVAAIRSDSASTDDELEESNYPVEKAYVPRAQPDTESPSSPSASLLEDESAHAAKLNERLENYCRHQANLTRLANRVRKHLRKAQRRAEAEAFEQTGAEERKEQWLMEMAREERQIVLMTRQALRDKTINEADLAEILKDNSDSDSDVPPGPGRPTPLATIIGEKDMVPRSPRLQREM